ncbi:unnamed protein product [Phytophthora lilii]|uniref:Unnamed protein product n=1 Tax=Phytophthora lilii TaxID=2077276 RepID=A0A9W6TXD2_9STRA|nr:unnamed protein product [Phytophthora lilii]
MPRCARLKHRAQPGPHREHVTSEDMSEAPNGEFSLVALRLCWLVFVILHAFCGTYFALMSLTYWKLPGTTFGRWLYFYDLGLDPEHDGTISIVHGCIAAVHFGYLVWMIGWSIENRRLVFAVYNLFGPPTATTTEGETAKFVICIGH